MTFGILIFPGAHGDRDLSDVIEGYYGQKVVRIWNRQTNLNGIDALLIPGGFPCKGSSHSSKCINESPVIDSMIEYADRGKIIVGIGNGFRVLCETGLVPGTLRMNKTQRFICTNTYIKPDNNDTSLTSLLSTDLAYQIPISTGYGRYTAKDSILVDMRLNDQILFRYCDEFGVISEGINLTGAVDNIAGICNERKNVFGLIPQPERAVFPYGGNTDGDGLFRSLMRHF
jgi:phosphoribosylformylglycinamidine synthase I